MTAIHCNKAHRWLVAMLAALASTGALAQQAGDWVFGAGWLHFATRDSSSPLSFTAPRPTVLPGSGATVGNADTLGLSVNYFIDSHWVVEGVFGVPPKFDLYGIGTLASIGQLGEAKQWSPTVVGKYYFGDAEAKLRPYLGVGVAYVRYSGVKLTSSLQGALGARLGAPPGATVTTAKLDNSFVPVFNAGIAWQFDRHWGASFSVSYLPLKTTAVLSTNAALTGLPLARSQATVKVHPVIPYLAVTYRY